MRKCLIIDDEPNSRDLLKIMLEEYCAGVEVVGMAGSVQKAIEAIQALTPDLLFLDMELQGGDGFAVMDAFPNPGFEVVVISGYDADFLRQLDYAALAYLTKPVVIQELQVLLTKLIGIPLQKDQIQHFKETQGDSGNGKERIFLMGNQGHASVDLKQIAFVEAQRTYARIVLVNGGEHISAHPLKHYESLLPGDRFFRIHKSYLLNLEQVREYDKGRTGFVHLQNGDSLPLAARRKADFVRILKKK